jgi:hypothetical protein
VAGFLRNGWPFCSGTGGRFGPENAADIENPLAGLQIRKRENDFLLMGIDTRAERRN